jgi:hypothetical protein
MFISHYLHSSTIYEDQNFLFAEAKKPDYTTRPAENVTERRCIKIYTENLQEIENLEKRSEAAFNLAISIHDNLEKKLHEIRDPFVWITTFVDMWTKSKNATNARIKNIENILKLIDDIIGTCPAGFLNPEIEAALKNKAKILRDKNQDLKEANKDSRFFEQKINEFWNSTTQTITDFAKLALFISTTFAPEIAKLILQNLFQPSPQF